MRSDWACDASFPLCVAAAAACAAAVGRHISINLKISGKWRVSAATTLSPCFIDHIMDNTTRSALAVPKATSAPNLILSMEFSWLPQTQSHFGNEAAVDKPALAFVVPSSVPPDRSNLRSGSGLIVGELAIADETQIATKRRVRRIFEDILTDGLKSWETAWNLERILREE